MAQPSTLGTKRWRLLDLCCASLMLLAAGLLWQRRGGLTVQVWMLGIGGLLSLLSALLNGTERLVAQYLKLLRKTILCSVLR